MLRLIHANGAVMSRNDFADGQDGGIAVDEAIDVDTPKFREGLQGHSPAVPYRARISRVINPSAIHFH